MIDKFWTDDRVAIATDMKKRGFNNSQIANELGTTRNAVIGKLSRLAAGQPPLPQLPPLPPQPEIVDEDFDVTPRSSAIAAVLALRWDSCRWPIGDAREDGFRFCLAKQHRGSYCREHAKEAFK